MSLFLAQGLPGTLHDLNGDLLVRFDHASIKQHNDSKLRCVLSVLCLYPHSVLQSVPLVPLVLLGCQVSR